MEERIRRLTEHIASGYHCQAQVKYIRQVPVVNNNQTCVNHVSQVIRLLIGSVSEVEASPTTGGEDFSFYLNQIPGCFFWLGSGPLVDAEKSYGLHSPNFVVNEDCISLGASLFAALILYRLDGNNIELTVQDKL